MFRRLTELRSDTSKVGIPTLEISGREAVHSLGGKLAQAGWIGTGISLIANDTGCANAAGGDRVGGNWRA